MGSTKIRIWLTDNFAEGHQMRLLPQLLGYLANLIGFHVGPVSIVHEVNFLRAILRGFAQG